jgi:hypothetical protein
MSISTYSELQAAIADWMNRSDLDDAIPNFIALTEANMKKRFFTMGSESVATYEVVAGENRVPVPDSYMGIRSMHVQSSINSVLRMVSMDKLKASYASATTGIPEVFTVASDYFVLAPTPDGEYVLELDYYRFDALSDTNTTNWILTHYPDLYLFGSLAEAKGYIKDEALISLWLSRYEKAAQELDERDKAERYGTDLRSRPYGMTVV